MSHVDFKKHPMSCRLFFFLVSLGSMSHVDFKEWTCRRVEFRGQEPHEEYRGYFSLEPIQYTDTNIADDKICTLEWGRGGGFLCHMSILRKLCLPVEFKKWSLHPIEFKKLPCPYLLKT